RSLPSPCRALRRWARPARPARLVPRRSVARRFCHRPRPHPPPTHRHPGHTHRDDNQKRPLTAARSQTDTAIGSAALGVVTASGEIICADRLLMLFAEDIVTRNPGADIVFDVKCTRRLPQLISQLGGRPVMWKSGHSMIKAKMQEVGALFGGEMSGHL